MTMSDVDIAVALLILDEGPPDDPIWEMHWKSLGPFCYTQGLIDPHRGDCTNECQTCRRCSSQALQKRIPLVRRLFGLDEPA